jgi:hypothetical protein
MKFVASNVNSKLKYKIVESYYMQGPNPDEPARINMDKVKFLNSNDNILIL